MNPPTANQPRPDDSVPKDGFFNPGWGAPILWIVSIAFALLVLAFLSAISSFVLVLLWPLTLALLLILATTTILFVIDFVCALCKRHWWRAVLHVVIAIATLAAAHATVRYMEPPPSPQ